jgi:hypothetical protein
MKVAQREPLLGEHVVDINGDPEPLLRDKQRPRPDENKVRPLEKAPQVCAGQKNQKNWCNGCMFLFVSLLCIAAFGGSGFCLYWFFGDIWQNGFTGALLMGGAVYVAKLVAMWLWINLFTRKFLTSVLLSRDNKESVPILEWFKAWLPRYLETRGRSFRQVQPLFRKKDGTTFFSFLQDIRCVCVLCVHARVRASLSSRFVPARWISSHSHAGPHRARIPSRTRHGTESGWRSS